MASLTRLTITLVLVACVLAGCRGEVEPGNSRQSGKGTVVVYTVNYPLKYFADQIGGPHVDVVFPAPADEDPAFWTPDAETVSAYQQADLILLNGATYAKWVPKVTLPESKLIDTTKAIKDQYIVVKDAATHSHGSGEEHSHEGTAFTTWLDPTIALAQAEAIHQALVEMRPMHEDLFNENYEALKADLDTLDQKLKTATADANGQPAVFSHPVFQYLERRYEIDGKSLHWEPDSIPPDDAWEDLRDHLKNHPAKWMIWEGQPLEESVEKLKELGVESIVFDPCGNTPTNGDWLEVMNRNANELARIYSDATLNPASGN